MRSDRVADLLVLLTVLSLVGYLLYAPPGEPTGRAIDSFSPIVEVSLVAVNVSDAVNLAVPVVNGSLVPMAMPVTYNGTGSTMTAVTRPPGYENATAWSINESGTLKDVNVSGENLVWVADLDAGSATLTLLAPPPSLVVEFVVENGTDYMQQVRVDSSIHFTGVTATTQVSGLYQYYRLYEVDLAETDVTTLYNLTLNGTAATWSGFDLFSTRVFRFRGSANPPPQPPSGRGGGGGGGGFIPENESQNRPLPSNASAPAQPPPPEKPQFRLPVRNVALNLTEGEAKEFLLSIVNEAQAERRFTVWSTASWLQPATTSLTIEGGKEGTFIVTARGLSLGEWYGRVLVTDGRTQVETRVAAFVAPAPASEEQPETQLPGAAQPPMSGSFIALSIFMLVTMLGLLGYIFYYSTREPKM